MKQSGRLYRFLNGKGFYVALGICMIAIGISAWTALGKLNSDTDTIDTSSPIVSSSAELSSELQTNKTEDNVSADLEESVVTETSEPTESEETAAQAPVAKYFLYPVSGEIIKGFSDSELQYSLTFNDMRLHTGIDIKADAGTAVKAAGDGVVLSAELDPELGYTVKIDHGNGITGVYAGLGEAMTVAKGDNVTAGTNLGPLGTVSNECVDAPHLHLEFYENDTPIDPKTLLSES